MNIFNMSLLDILCGALGAFCFMMLALFPFYRPTVPAARPPSEADAEKLGKRVEELRQDVSRARTAGQNDVAVTRENTRLKRALQDARRALDTRYQDASAGPRAAFVVVELKSVASGRCEYEIEVERAPAGADPVSGPFRDEERRVIGATLVLIDPPPGEYDVFYKLNRGTCSVSGAASASTGSRHPVATTQLTRPGERRPVGVLVVDRAGRLTVR
jgi:hypothetical protein